MSLYTGTVESVVAEPRQANVTTDAAAASSTLLLDNVGPFLQAGGQALVDGVLLDYLTVDTDAESMTLAAPLAAPVTTDSTVQAAQQGVGVIDWKVNVLLDGQDGVDDEPVPATVTLEYIPYLREGVADAGKRVTLSATAQGLYLDEIDGGVPLFDGSLLDPEIPLPPELAGTSASVSLTATSQILTAPAAGGATNPATSTVTGTAVNTTITAWTYSVDGAAFSATVPAGVSRTGDVVTVTGSSMTARTIAVKMADAAGVSDTLTVARVLDGAAGSAGGAGAAGADAYTVLLTNEAHVFPGSTTAALAGSATSGVLAYLGAVQQSATIGTITGQVTGLTTSVQNNGTTSAGFTVTVTTSLTTTGGTLTVPVTVGGVTFTKKFSWSLSLTGATGADLAASDGLAPLGSPTPTVYGAFGALAVTFTPLTVPGTRSTTVNPDPVTYDVHLSTTSTVAGDSTTQVGKAVAGSPVFIRATQAGTPLTAGTNYWVAVRSKDRDGNGPLSTVAGPVQTTAATGGDVVLTTGMLIASHVLAAAIEAEDLNGRVITGPLIRTSASGNRLELTNADELRFYSGDAAETASGNMNATVAAGRPALNIKSPAFDANPVAQVNVNGPGGGLLSEVNLRGSSVTLSGDSISFYDRTSGLQVLRYDGSTGKIDLLNGAVFGAGGIGTSTLRDSVDNRVGAVAPAIHKARHATGGADPLTPADIGALDQTATDARVTAVAPTVTMTTGSVGTGAHRDSVRTALNGDYAEAWTTYTPTFTAPTTNPTLANFTRTGRYVQRGKQVTVTIVIVCNTAAGLGSGVYEFGLPVTARNVNEVVGAVMVTGPNVAGSARAVSTTTVSVYSGANGAGMSAANTALTAGGIVRINITYEAA